jgi:membrane-bound lytic murein transglycosylase MltF
VAPEIRDEQQSVTSPDRQIHLRRDGRVVPGRHRVFPRPEQGHHGTGARQGTLRVALTQANPPWNFLGRGNRPMGYDVDVARDVARRIGAGEVTFIGADFASFIGGIRADKFDIVIAGQTSTAKRREQVDFSRPYALNGVAIFVRKGNTSINGLKDLTGKKIAVSEGTVQAEFARTHIRDAQVKTSSRLSLHRAARPNELGVSRPSSWSSIPPWRPWRSAPVMPVM